MSFNINQYYRGTCVIAITTILEGRALLSKLLMVQSSVASRSGRGVQIFTRRPRQYQSGGQICLIIVHRAEVEGSLYGRGGDSHLATMFPL